MSTTRSSDHHDTSAPAGPHPDPSAAGCGCTSRRESLLAAGVVVAGAAVWARWQGGTPPFTVEITRPSRPKRALAAATAETREARLDVPAQAAGRLTLVIRDAAGLEARAPLRAQAAPPPTPEWIAAGAPTPEMRQLAAAAHLLGDDKRRYQLLAAGMAAELGSAPARALLDIIARGDRPK